MASNYPPGVTGNERQIAGGSHYNECPLNESFEFRDEDLKRLDPYELKALFEAAESAKAYNHDIRRTLEPFQWLLDCCCDDIAAAQRDEAAERRDEAKETL